MFFKKRFGFFYFLFCLFTAIVGKEVHGSTFWAVVDFFIAPISWLIWLLEKEVSLTVIQEAIKFFFQ